MINLNKYGYKDFYFLDNEKVYNSKTNRYLIKDKQGSFTIEREDGRPHHISANKLYKRIYGAFYSNDIVEDLPNEEWRKIKNSGYSISSLGRVKSHKDKETMIVSQEISTGYARVNIDIGYGTRKYLVHRLVAEYFLELPNKPFCIIHHKDLNKLNNCYKNLMYVTTDEHNYLHNIINEGTREIEREFKQKKNTN